MTDHQLLWGIFAFACFIGLIVVAIWVSRKNGGRKQ